MPTLVDVNAEVSDKTTVSPEPDKRINANTSFICSGDDVVHEASLVARGVETHISSVELPTHSRKVSFHLF